MRRSEVDIRGPAPRFNPIVTGPAFHGPMREAAVPTRVITVARSFVAAAVFGYFFDLYHQTQNHLLNAAGRPFGDDWVNYWSAGYLALHGRAAEIYDLHVFHAFQQTIVGSPLDGYHYSYPPVMLLLTAPFALIPYVPALFVWLSASWYAFYRALKLAMPGRGVLLPVALIAGRQWRAIAAAAVTAGALLGLSWLVFGPELWAHYLRNLTALRHVVLESDISPRMVSVFIAARSLGASVETAYWAQGAFGALACLAVAVVWFKQTPAALKNAALLLGTCLAMPYLQDYDLVFGAMVVAWLWQQPVDTERSEGALQIACGLLLVLPLVAAALAHLTGIAFGPLFILPLFIVALQMSFAAWGAAVTASSSRLSSAQP